MIENVAAILIPYYVEIYCELQPRKNYKISVEKETIQSKYHLLPS